MKSEAVISTGARDRVEFFKLLAGVIGLGGFLILRNGSKREWDFDWDEGFSMRRFKLEGLIFVFCCMFLDDFCRR